MTYRRLMLSLPCLFFALGVVAGRAAAQTCTAPIPAGTCTASTSTTMTVGTVLRLSLSASSTILTPPATAGYDAGFVADNGPATTVTANRSWTLRITAGSAFWTASNTTPGVIARVTKPAADLQWSTSPGGSFTGVTVAGATFTSGGGTAPAGTTTTIAYRTLYSWVLDTPGAYSLVVVLTLTAP